MMDGLEHIRATLGDERQSALTDQEIKDSLYEAYFDVEQAIAALLGMLIYVDMVSCLTGPQRSKSESLLPVNVKVSFIPVDPLPLPFACVLYPSFSLICGLCGVVDWHPCYSKRCGSEKVHVLSRLENRARR